MTQAFYCHPLIHSFSFILLEQLLFLFQINTSFGIWVLRIGLKSDMISKEAIATDTLIASGAIELNLLRILFVIGATGLTPDVDDFDRLAVLVL